MAKYRIAVIGGDGIGPEVIDQAVRVAEKAARRDGGHLNWNHLPWGSAYYLEHGRILPSDGWDILKQHDAILFGAIGSPKVPEAVTAHELLLPMRRRFDQYVNLRPSVLYDGVPCPLRDKAPGSIDIAMYRENTEGEYAPIGGRLYPGLPAELAIQTAVFTRRGCERVMRAAFAAARTRKKKVTSITKSNALIYGLALWDESFQTVAAEFPDVHAESLLVDAAAMDLVRRPERFDVVTASNLFGDILTDLAAAVTGSIGLASSANMNPERVFPSMFEPVHGSAPDIAGKGIANPLAAILSAALMLDHLGLAGGAGAIRDAVTSVLKSGEARSPDLGGKATTTEVAEAVLSRV
jgi:tartrate dehydrogenase/decarboxylase/D-malate dehydrogenase